MVNKKKKLFKVVIDGAGVRNDNVRLILLGVDNLDRCFMRRRRIKILLYKQIISSYFTIFVFFLRYVCVSTTSDQKRHP